MSDPVENYTPTGMEIAIIGMSVRFPGAASVQAFWQNLRDGVESITSLSDEELIDAGEDPAKLREPNYVKAAGVLEGIELFDASFFGIYPREAELMDPQQRIFLECSWEALESAGYDPETYPKLIGVYAGTGLNAYLLNNIIRNESVLRSTDPYQLVLLNDKDFLATRISYKLNLKGPSVVVQSSCSTSLVAVHQACQSLLGYQCDMALAGGVSIRLPNKRGYQYQEGGIASHDGHCRAFDEQASGTIGGSGAGVVVLKRLEDALADGDCIHAIIKGSAVNNDGAAKVGYTAPSIEGQAEVIAMAHAAAGVEPPSISYVEAHGTGTTLGDPIEIAALTQAFQEGASRAVSERSCAIGSVKTNVGHLDTAAGVAGLIKTTLSLEYRQLPPSLHFEQANPAINFVDSPFYVNAVLDEWRTNGSPRRAGVSSFGIGGTNAHVVLEEATVSEPSEPSRAWQLLTLSARTSEALAAVRSKLADHFEQDRSGNLTDTAYTTHVGRKAFKERSAIVCRDLDDAIRALQSGDPRSVVSGVQEGGSASVVFMFPGQGTQYVQMGRELYDSEPAFRQEVDRAAELLKSDLNLDLRHLLYPRAEVSAKDTSELNQTAVTQPALFVTEYALAKLWMSWGVHPAAMVGHSIGEYTAACLAGVFSFADALHLVALRGRLMQAMANGAMLAVPLTETEIQPYLGGELSLAAINGPTQCVVSGPTWDIERLDKDLAGKGVTCRRLETSHAFHSTMMEPMLARFTEEVRKVELNAPSIPYQSNLSGTWITREEATDPAYWSRHLRHTVRFSDNLRELSKQENCLLLEVGPGQTLSAQARRHEPYGAQPTICSSLPHRHEQQSEAGYLLKTLGQLWIAGAKIDWHGFHGNERRRRVPLPTYPFERQRYWIEPTATSVPASVQHGALQRRQDISDWFYTPVWKQGEPLFKASVETSASQNGDQKNWLVFGDQCGVGEQLIQRLEQQGHQVVTVLAGDVFEQVDDRTLTINPERGADYVSLFKALAERDLLPQEIVHLWSVSESGASQSALESFAATQQMGFYSLLFLTQALAELRVKNRVQVSVVSTNAYSISGSEDVCPAQATVLAACNVIPQEYPHITCRSVDVVLFDRSVTDSVWAEITAESRQSRAVAYRGGRRWVQSFEPLKLPAAQAHSRVRDGGVYLVTGGLGRIGLLLATFLARQARVKLVLIGRSGLGARADWNEWLSTHDSQDRISRAIRGVQRIEELGSDVYVAEADVADEAQMRTVMDHCRARFGSINGVVHAAGLVGEEWLQGIGQTTSELCEAQFRSKALGLCVLDQLLRDNETDFCIAISSLSSVLGGLGFTAYSAANLYMDAFAQQQFALGRNRWLSIDWDGWQIAEGAAAADSYESITPENDIASMAIRPAEGLAVFARALEVCGLMPQLIVSTADLSARINQWLKRRARREEQGNEANGIAGYLQRHPRPALPNYEAPRNEMEQSMAQVWQETLGIDQVGIHDNFFALGGDSLLATQLIPRLHEKLYVEIPLRNFFESPTIAGLMLLMAELTSEHADDEEAEILKLLEQLSEDEIEAELQKRLQQGSRVRA
ncbi:MAG: SDR family NAD(P)-dependent oxidoreductase [Pyrinomonadaceae bacterium]|nr:SDR family NAD(P)-dependent oxidoreductase [Pyrinomonadaceae bacterium]